MCVTAWIGDTEIQSVAELRRALGVAVIENEDILRANVAARGGDLDACCLCVVDMEATAKAVGKSLLWGADGDPMSVVFKARNIWTDDPANFEKLRQNFTTSLLIEGPNMTLEEMSERLVEMREEIEDLRRLIGRQGRHSD